MRNKVKVAGVAVTGALIVLAGLLAVRAVPGENVPTSAAVYASGGESGHASTGPGAATICAGCEAPVATGPGTSGTGHGSDTSAVASTPAHGEDQLQAYSPADCCAIVPTPQAVPSNEAESQVQSGFAPLALAGGGTSLTGLGGAGIPGGALSDGGAGGSIGTHAPQTGGNGTGGRTGNDPVSTVDPGTGGDVVPPDLGYCINPVGAYCGGGSGQPEDAAPPIGPVASLPVPPTTTPNTNAPPASPSEPQPPLQVKEPEQGTPTEVPEPTTVALIAIGIAGLRALRRTG